jgi:hypothetical protein
MVELSPAAASAGLELHTTSVRRSATHPPRSPTTSTLPIHTPIARTQPEPLLCATAAQAAMAIVTDARVLAGRVGRTRSGRRPLTGAGRRPSRE